MSRYVDIKPTYLALPVNEYLNAVIIIQLSIKLPLLAAWHTSFACPKQVSRKRHPTMAALRAPLRCSPVAGRQKLADAQTGLASCSTTGSAAQRHRMGNSTRAHTCPGTRYPDDLHIQNNATQTIFLPKTGGVMNIPDTSNTVSIDMGVHSPAVFKKQLDRYVGPQKQTDFSWQMTIPPKIS